MKNIIVNIVLIIVSFVYFCFISVYNHAVHFSGTGIPHVLDIRDIVLNIIGFLLVMLVGFIFAQISGKIARIIAFSVFGVLGITLLIYSVFFMTADFNILKGLLLISISYIAVLDLIIEMPAAVYVIISFGLPVIGFIAGCVYKRIVNKRIAIKLGEKL